ncbi:MAG TPA: D-alanyl-D-alanine carboxypeptidase family protein [Xanthomonadaceae bacterium]|nr:D-alanyl-D-alanine carboxypeptidase family protein [Xanthomonadaceae bacterium]
MSTSRLLAALLGLGLAAAAFAQSPAPSPAPVPPPAAATPIPDAPQLSARSYVLMDFATGRVLAERDASARVEPASLTKMMTSLIVFEEIDAGRLGLDTPVTISEKAWRTGGSKMFVEVGKQVTVSDLLMGLIVQSGNDATVALAEQVAGSEDAFAQMMNAAAAKLGMTDTHFVNADGLPDPEHYTTARDMALLSHALIAQHPEAYEWYAVREFTFNGITQHNRNSLLWREAGVDGIKTGHTEGAGYCLAASAVRDDMRLIAVVMGAASEKIRAQEALSLLNYGFRFFESHTVYAAGTEVAAPPIWKSELDTLPLGVAEPLVVTIPRGRYQALQASMDLPRQLVAPVAKGARVGSVNLTLGGEPVASAPLVALAEAPEAGFFGRLVDGFWMWWESD